MTKQITVGEAHARLNRTQVLNVLSFLQAEVQAGRVIAIDVSAFVQCSSKVEHLAIESLDALELLDLDVQVGTGVTHIGPLHPFACEVIHNPQPQHNDEEE